MKHLLYDKKMLENYQFDSSDFNYYVDNPTAISVTRNELLPLDYGYSKLYIQLKDQKKNFREALPKAIKTSIVRVYDSKVSEKIHISRLVLNSEKSAYEPIQKTTLFSSKNGDQKQIQVLRIAAMDENFIKQETCDLLIEPGVKDINYELITANNVAEIEKAHNISIGCVDDDNFCKYVLVTLKDNLSSVRADTRMSMVSMTDKGEMVLAVNIPTIIVNLDEVDNLANKGSQIIKISPELSEKRMKGLTKFASWCVEKEFGLTLLLLVVFSFLFFWWNLGGSLTSNTTITPLAIYVLRVLSAIFMSAGLMIGVKKLFNAYKTSSWKEIWRFVRENLSLKLLILLSGVLFVAVYFVSTSGNNNLIETIIDITDKTSQVVVILTIFVVLFDKYNVWFKKQPKATQNDVAFVVATNLDTEKRVKTFIEESSQIYSGTRVVVANLPDNITRDNMHDVYSILADKFAQVKAYNPNTVHLFCQGPVIIGVAAGALAANNMQVLMYHFDNSTYVNYGKMEHNLSQINTW